LIQYSKSVFVHLLFGILVLSLGANSVLAQGNQSSQQQSKAMPPPGVIQPMSNETTEGFGNVTEVQNLTALNQQALENQSAAAQQQGNQSSNQTSNQSAASGGGGGAQQQQGNQSSNQTSNQSAASGGGGAQQQQGNQSSNQTSNQSAASGGGGGAQQQQQQQQQQGNQSKGPIEQIGQAINKMFGGK
jgi:hypothetical protein